MRIADATGAIRSTARGLHGPEATPNARRDVKDEPEVVATYRPPLAELESALIDEFVRARGYDPARLSELPQHEREALLKDASVYASSTLTEVESRARFLDDIHNRTPGIKTGLD